MKEQNAIEKGKGILSGLNSVFGTGFQVTVKIVLSGIVILFLMIPSSMIMSIIKEREERKDDVVKEISGKWGGVQTIAGPFISIPSKQKDANGAVKYFHFLPDELSLSGKLNPEIRYRGIFDTVVYASTLDFTANFADVARDDNDLDFSKAMICIGLSDLKGITNPVSATINGKAVEFSAGLPSDDLGSCGISTKIPPEFLKKTSDERNMQGLLLAKLKIDLNGSREISFLPLGKTTDVKIQSSWNSPSFSGAYLPVAREVKENGFDAGWKILEMNRAYPQKWSGKAHNVADSSFGVKFVIPVNIYQQTSRTAKYALLFIVFTFSSFFFTEFLTKMRIHIVQYLMTGLAVVMFYSLLLAVSEHISFARAYFVSAAAVVILIGFYTRGILKRLKFSLALSGIISILYTYFYVILQMEDYALLTGNIGLFTVLAIFMFITRNINRAETVNETVVLEKGEVL